MKLIFAGQDEVVFGSYQSDYPSGWAWFFLASLLFISLAARLLAQAKADTVISPASCDE